MKHWTPAIILLVGIVLVCLLAVKESPRGKQIREHYEAHPWGPLIFDGVANSGEGALGQ